MSFFHSWAKQMCEVPKKVLFVAAVASVATLYVSQEVGTALAEEQGSETGAPQQQMMVPPPSMQPGPQMQQPGGQPAQPQPPQMLGQQGPQGQNFQKQEPFERPEGSQMMPQKAEKNFEGEKRGQDQFDNQRQFDQQKPNQPNQFQQNMMGQQPKQMGPQQFQPNDQGREQDFEKQQSEQSAQNLKRLQQQLTSMTKQMKQFTSRIASFEKRGVPVSSDLKNAVADIDKISASIAGLADENAAMEALDTLQGDMQTLQDGMRQMEMLAQFKQQITQAQSQVKRLEKQVDSVAKQAAKSKIDLSSQVSDLRTMLTDMKTGLDSATQAYQAGDAETAMETLRSDVYEKFNDIQSAMESIKMLQNVSRAIPQFSRMSKRVQSLIVQKEKRGEDMTDVRSQAQELDDSIAELQKLAATRGADPEDLRDAAARVFDAQQALSDFMGGENNPKIQIQQPAGQGQSQGSFQPL